MHDDAGHRHRAGGTCFHYRCGGKHRTASTGCKVRDLPVEAVAHEELRALLQTVIDAVEWREDATDPFRGTAVIQFFELPEGFWAAYEAHKE